jgi:enamine deaminase RidA (YjgF/YER057c/UK114 family)
VSALSPVEPEGWPRPRGYSNGMIAPAGARVLFVAGQIALDEKQALVGAGDLPAQFRKTLENVVAVVRAAGGEPKDIGSMTAFVTDLEAYRAALKPLGTAWKEVMGDHYPAMALVGVAGLVMPGALIEIQAIAAIPGGPARGRGAVANALRASLEQGKKT